MGSYVWLYHKFSKWIFYELWGFSELGLRNIFSIDSLSEIKAPKKSCANFTDKSPRDIWLIMKNLMYTKTRRNISINSLYLQLHKQKNASLNWKLQSAKCIFMIFYVVHSTMMVGYVVNNLHPSLSAFYSRNLCLMLKFRLLNNGDFSDEFFTALVNVKASKNSKYLH